MRQGNREKQELIKRDGWQFNWLVIDYPYS